MYLVIKAFSNDEDWTGTVPKIFENLHDAELCFEEALKEAFDSFVKEWYCAKSEYQNAYDIWQDDSQEEEVRTPWTLRYSYLNGCFDFWNSTWFDFWYSIELHEMSLDN